MMSRAALRRVVQSLLSSQQALARGARAQHAHLHSRLPAIWPDALRLTEEGDLSLGCDSLERLQLAAAANEMFQLYETGDEANLLMMETLGEWLDHIAQAMRRDNPCVTFLTSGSTGVPKRCSHSVAHLNLEVAALAQLFADRRRIVALAPAHHIYGFIFTAMLADELGVEVWSAEPVSPGELARGLRPGDLVVSFPERWSWLERSIPEWPPNVGGVTSTAPCPDGLVSSLRARGVARIVEIYGSSETAGVAWRDEPEAAYTLMPQWRFAPATDAEASAIVHATGFEASLPDHVVKVGSSAFRLGGRIDGAVQIGGINVYANRIADLLSDRPGVQTAVVRLMRKDQGARLKAFVVPESGVDAEALEITLAAWCASQLPAAERPTSFTFGANLPRSGLGKLIDW